LKALFFTPRWYAGLCVCIALLFVSYFIEPLLTVAGVVCAVFFGLTVLEILMLFRRGAALEGERIVPPRLSLGDPNEVTIALRNPYGFEAHVRYIDELPVQFQERKFLQRATVRAGREVRSKFILRPTSRGVFSFGNVLAYVSTPIGFVQRRTVVAGPQDVKVYPSFANLRRYSLLAVADRSLPGVRRVRRLGHSMEFEKIKEYVRGDDVRTINWKATARRGDLMVNTYTDAREQQVYCLIDKGRAMRSPFDGLTLLDYAINASLAILNMALLRHDRAGLITFAEKVHDVVPAERSGSQMAIIMERLYGQATAFKESDYESVITTVRRSVGQRSFLLLFTNFESTAALERQLPHLRSLAARHLLCVVFFQNTLLDALRHAQPETTEGLYIRTIADRFDFEKRAIVKELRRHGILSLLTTPASLTVDVINQYLELKARQMI